MTPETDASTHYHWAIGRDLHVDKPEVTKVLFNEIHTAFEQDREILEMQQESIDLFVDPQNVDIIADSGGIQARRMLRHLLAEEAEASKATPVRGAAAEREASSA